MRGNELETFHFG